LKGRRRNTKFRPLRTKGEVDISLMLKPPKRERGIRKRMVNQDREYAKRRLIPLAVQKD